MPIVRDTFSRAAPERRSRSMPSTGGVSTAAGVNVSPERALQISAVYSCVRLLAETVSGLPITLLRRTEEGRERVRANPLLRLVADEPNPDMDSVEYFRLIMAFMLLRGNGFGYVQRNRSGDPIGLWPLPRTCVDVRRGPSGRLVYAVAVDDDNFAPVSESGGLVQRENMLHYRAFGLGVEGLSPIGLARQSVGIAWAAQQYVGGFFSRDASPGGVVTVPGELSDKAYGRMIETWEDLHEGFDKSHRLALLEGGAKWEKVSLSPADAAFLEIYGASRTDVCGMYGVPPSMIGATEKSTTWGTGLEQMSQGFVTYGAMPWVTRLERVTGRLRGSDPDLYLKMTANALVRGDITARNAAYGQARQWGWYSVNDIRRLEDEEPVEGGDVYLQPVNMVPAGTVLPGTTRSVGPALRAAPEIPGTAAMVALYPPPAAAAALAVPGGLPVDELHVTLAYLGEDLTERQLADAATVVSSVAAQHRQLGGAVGGLGQFPAGEDGVPYWAPVDVPGLAELRHRLVRQLGDAGVPVAADHGWTPHLTLTYGDQAPEVVDPVEVGFGAVSLTVGGRRADYPFTGTRSRPAGGRQFRADGPPAEELPVWVTRHHQALADYWTRQAEDVLAAYGPSTRSAQEAAAEAAAPAWNEQLAELLLNLALGLAADAGGAAARALGGTFTADWARAYLEANADAAAANINRTTAEQVAAIVLAAEGGADPREALVELFTRMLTTRAADVATGRVNEVGNFGRHEGARQAGATGKTWRTTGTESRPTHVAADGQTVSMDDRFTVGEARGRWPRDHRLGVDEIAGCRCTLTFTKEE